MTVTLDLDLGKSDPPTRRALDELSLAVAKCKKIVVVTGAGISCSSGIPVSVARVHRKISDRNTGFPLL